MVFLIYECIACASLGSAVRPVPIAQTGSYAIIIFSKSEELKLFRILDSWEFTTSNWIPLFLSSRDSPQQKIGVNPLLKWEKK